MRSPPGRLEYRGAGQQDKDYRRIGIVLNVVGTLIVAFVLAINLARATAVVSMGRL